MIVSLILKAVARFRAPPVKTPDEEMNDFLMRLRAASDEELGGVLAGALLAKKTLDTTRQVDMPFPAEYLDGALPLDEPGRALLATYAADLKRFQAVCASAGTILGSAVARGLDTWIHTLRAMADPAGLPKAREAWMLLMKGEANIEAAYRFMTRRDITEVEHVYLAYRPKALISA